MQRCKRRVIFRMNREVPGRSTVLRDHTTICTIESGSWWTGRETRPSKNIQVRFCDQKNAPLFKMTQHGRVFSHSDSDALPGSVDKSQ
jgi:hypothetical protein